MTSPSVTMSGPDRFGVHVAEVFGLEPGHGDEWERMVRRREQAEQVFYTAVPDALVCGAAASSDTSYIFWYHR